MAEKMLKKGDKVRWKSPGGNARGEIVKKQTSRNKIKDYEVKASKDNPQFIVETSAGTRAAHKAEALKKES